MSHAKDGNGASAASHGGTVREVTLPEGVIRYREWGEGSPILFVHGLLVNGEIWYEVAATLSANHRCIAPDWPLGSHEIPMREDADLSPAGVAAVVAHFMEALDLRDVTLVGNDSGGAISQLVACRHPARLARLVLTDCDALEVFPPKAFAYLTWIPRVPGAMFVMARAMLHAPFLRRMPMAYGDLSEKRLPDALLRRWVEPAATDAAIRRDVGKFMRGASPEVTLETAAALPGFDRPVLLLWSRDDRHFPLALAERLLMSLRRGRLQPLDTRHLLTPLDRPAIVAAEIARFVGEAGTPAVRAAS